MKQFNIYKKRDGREFEFSDYILAENFKEAKKSFAHNMTDDNRNRSNNIVWLTVEDGVEETGWYDLDMCGLVADDFGNVDYAESDMELHCSESAIKKGFDTWRDDVYTWELRK